MQRQPPLERRVVAVALSRGATIINRELDLTKPDVAVLSGVLDHLVRLGIVACYSIIAPAEVTDLPGLFADFWPYVGLDALAAVVAASPPPPERPPAYLCSVWPFEACSEGLIAHAQFLGHDMDFVAVATDDEETGFHLAEGGPYLARARPTARIAR